MVVEQVNDILSTPGTIPVPLIKKLWIDEFSLGIKPPRIERVKTFGNTANDVVLFTYNSKVYAAITKDASTDFTDGTDILVDITGVTGTVGMGDFLV